MNSLKQDCYTETEFRERHSELRLRKKVSRKRITGTEEHGVGREIIRLRNWEFLQGEMLRISHLHL